jgi:hypothetical protein
MRHFVVFASLLMFFFSMPTFSQDRAAIYGTVLDPTGARVSDASVDLKETATGLRRVTLSDAHGLYQITALPVGSYTLTVSKEGFKPVSVDNIGLQYGETRTVNAKLQIGVLSETIRVVVAAEVLNQTNAEVGGVIELPQIKEIPVSGSFGKITSIINTGAVGMGAPRRIEFMFRAEF